MTLQTEISSPLEGALQYAKQGVRVFPTISDEDGKRQGEKFRKTPLVRAWDQYATTDEAQIQAWAKEFPDCNWGGLPASIGACVFDLDRKNGKDGFAAFKALLEQHNIRLPNTLAVETPSGGLHIVLRGVVRNSGSKIADGVDVRGEGGYVLLPGSRIDGKPYTIKRPFDLDSIPDAPAKLIELASAQRHAKQEAAADFVEDLAVNVRRFSAYLERQDAPSPGSRDVDCFRHVCIGRDFGLSAHSNAEITRDHWLSRDTTPGDDPDQFTADDLAAKIESAYGGNAQNAQGAYAHPDPKIAFAPAIEAAAASEAKTENAAKPANDVDRRKRLLRPMLWDEYSQMPDPEWLIEGVLPAFGTGINFGTRGSFKSFVHLDWCIGVSLGRHPTLKIAKQGATAYCIGEDPKAFAKKRVPAILDAHGVAVRDRQRVPFYIIPSVPLAQQVAEVEFVIAQLKATGQRFRLIVIDTVARSMRGLNQNDAGDAAILMAAMERVREEFDCLVLGIHHVGHDDNTRAKGSTTFEDDVDVGWLFQGNKKDRLLQITNRKMRDDADGAKLFVRLRVADCGVDGKEWKSLVPTYVNEAEFKRGQAVEIGEDKYSRAIVMMALERLGAVGEDKNVTSAVLANKLLELWGEANAEPSALLPKADSVRKQLDNLLRKDKSPFAGLFMTAGGKAVPRWYLPEGYDEF
jgi:Bifunctional DNA primase/polymerase, N-terminal/AAA domain